jgi:hypothetical protein
MSDRTFRQIACGYGTVFGGCAIGLCLGQWISGDNPYHGRWGTWGGCLLGGLFGLWVTVTNSRKENQTISSGSTVSTTADSQKVK